MNAKIVVPFATIFPEDRFQQHVVHIRFWDKRWSATPLDRGSVFSRCVASRSRQVSRCYIFVSLLTKDTDSGRHLSKERVRVLWAMAICNVAWVWCESRLNHRTRVCGHVWSNVSIRTRVLHLTAMFIKMLEWHVRVWHNTKRHDTLHTVRPTSSFITSSRFWVFNFHPVPIIWERNEDPTSFSLKLRS